VDNAILAHRLCNRIDYSISVSRSYASDLKRIRKAREDAIRRNNEGPDALTRIEAGHRSGDIPERWRSPASAACNLRSEG
jgi:hypothetical protein